jgi:anti-sigma factor RsiW
MTCDEHRTLLFLAGELDAEDRASFDRHLLECEACWRAVTEDRRGRTLAEALREPAPNGLADRIRLATETRQVGATPAPSTVAAPARRRWAHGRVAVAAGVLLVGAAAGAGTTFALTARSARTPAASAAGTSSMAATMTAVHLGHALPMHIDGPPVREPTTLGTAVSMTVAGVQLSVTYYRVGTGEALVVESHQRFAMPSGGTPGHHAGAWTAQLEGLTVWCANGTMSAAIVTPMPGAAADLALFLGMSV